MKPEDYEYEADDKAFAQASVVVVAIAAACLVALLWLGGAF